jgi:hypothetical protein
VVESERIEVRIALALGDVRLDAGDVFGEAVNLAARIEAEAESGEVWFSESIYWTLDRARIPVEEMGWRAVAGLREEVRLFRVARAAMLEPGDPPYAGIGLGLVAGLAPPLPGKLLCALPRRKPEALGSGTLRRVAVGVLVVAVAAAAGWWFTVPAAERWTRLGRFEAARLELDQLIARRGAEDGEVLYLRGLLELARADAAVGGTQRAAFRDWGRAVAAGNRTALSALAREGRSTECMRRRLAARALGESRSRDALEPLEVIARGEPPGPSPEGPIERLKRAVAGDGRCGAGDLAREATGAIEAAHPDPMQ